MSLPRRSLASALGLALILFTPSCGGSIEADDCGARHHDNLPLTLSTLVKYYRISDSVSQAGWVITARGVCTHVHSWVEYEIRVHALAGFDVEPIILYSANRIRNLPEGYRVEDGLHVLSGKDDFGIKDVYGDKPGSWDFMVIINFPNQGSTAADSAYIDSNIVSGEMSAEWWES